MRYFNELKKSMEYLAKNKKTFFIGQAVEVPGTAMTNTLKDINKKKTFRITSYRRDANGYHDRYAHEWIYSNKYFSKMEFFIISDESVDKSS